MCGIVVYERLWCIVVCDIVVYFSLEGMYSGLGGIVVYLGLGGIQ